MYSKAATLALVSCLLATQAENTTNTTNITSTPSLVVSFKDAADIIENNDDYSMLSRFVEKLNLTAALKNTVTVFAPTNKAFIALNESMGGNLTWDSNITDVLTYHVAAGFVDTNITVTENETEVVSLQGQNLTLTTADNKTWEVNNVKIEDSSAAEDNKGMVYQIDEVLKIPDIEQTSSAMSVAGSFSAAVALLVSLALVC